MLKTGGTGNSFSMVEMAIAANQSCVFLADDTSNDIAAFTGPSRGDAFAKVGNYSNVGLSVGGALAISKDGLALYSINSWSLNLSHWNINSDCSLSHVQDYVPLGSNGWGGVGLALSPNGTFLLYSSNGYIESFGINADHSLTDNGPSYFDTFPQCASYTCSPQVIAFTGNGSAIAVGNCCSDGQQFIFVANTSSTGVISNQAVLTLPSQPQLYSPQSPVFDSACLNQQKCYLYVGMTGYNDLAYPGGVTVVAFDKNDISGAKVISAQQNAASFGTIGQLGNWILQAGFPNTLTAFPIDYSNGRLGKGVVTIDRQGIGLTDFVAF